MACTDRRGQVCLALPFPTPGHLLPVGIPTLSSLSFALWEALKSLKGHQGVGTQWQTTELGHDPAPSPNRPPHSLPPRSTPRAVTHMCPFLWAQP